MDRSLRADYVLDSGSWGDGGFSPELGDTIAALPEVDASSPMRSAPVQMGGESTQVLAFDTANLDEVLDLDVTAGSLDEVTDGGIAVKADTEVRGHTLAVGDQVRVRFARTGVVPMTVDAVFAENVPGVDGAYVVGLDTFEANVTDQFDRQIYVSTADGVDADASLAAIEAVLEDWPNAEVQDQAAFKADITGEIDRMLNLIYGLLALAVIIALIGIANTLALSVHERRREIGLLRAVGMSRSQVRRTVRWEAVGIALLGTALGTGLAIAGAWGVIQALGTEVTAFTVPPTQVGIIVALAALAGDRGGAGPGPSSRQARRAGRHRQPVGRSIRPRSCRFGGGAGAPSRPGSGGAGLADVHEVVGPLRGRELPVAAVVTVERGVDLGEDAFVDVVVARHGPHVDHVLGRVDHEAPDLCALGVGDLQISAEGGVDLTVGELDARVLVVVPDVVGARRSPRARSPSWRST